MPRAAPDPDPALEREKIEAMRVDAISVFCRDVLVPEGYLGEDIWGSNTLLQPKVEVARTVAERWRAGHDTGA